MQGRGSTGGRVEWGHFGVGGEDMSDQEQDDARQTFKRHSFRLFLGFRA